eukprot:TRINITY_DN3952_c0_g1_i3.p1 TRINITY_DN3952_c0_g1~~TRINITY_DN3952_c0_g1_i3.p1  ORF type:complete len:272 (-),score=37.32 TRINITY_DN3952_c0_g1_i3:50-763(-)
MRSSSSFMLLFVLVGILFSSSSSSVWAQNGANGLDVSDTLCQGMTAEQWTCLRQQGDHSFAIVQAFRGGYQINQDTARCVADAWAANFSHVDIYVWMCPNCDGNVPASSAMDNLITYLQNNGVAFGMVWVDIELCDNDPSCWNSLQDNIDFIQEAVQTFQKHNIAVGIYSTAWEWERVFGSDFTGFSNLPLWYANPNGNETFSDFGAFGGWNWPAIKQYNWYGSDCGASYDADWYPL